LVSPSTLKRSQGRSRSGARVSSGTQAGAITGIGTAAMTGAVDHPVGVLDRRAMGRPDMALRGTDRRRRPGGIPERRGWQLLRSEWSMSVVCCSYRCVNLASWAERKGVAQGLNTGIALVVRQRISVTTTPRSTLRGGRNHPPSSAQLGPPSSVEPTVRPGLAGLVAVKRGREPATRPGNNPEMGCESRDHSRSLTRNG
jgi:hypothetical protein